MNIELKISITKDEYLLEKIVIYCIDNIKYKRAQIMLSKKYLILDDSLAWKISSTKDVSFQGASNLFRNIQDWFTFVAYQLNWKEMGRSKY